MTVMVCVGLLTAIRISGTATLRGWVVLDARLASETAGLELVDVSGDFDWVSEPASMLAVSESTPPLPS